MSRIFGTGVCLLLLLVVSGCGGKPMPETAPVQGVVRLNGKPQKGLMVRFLPDPEQGNDTSFYATGITDEQGKYVMEYEYEGKQGQGAAVGWHRVIVADTLGYAAPGQPPKPPLISYDYASPASSPLRAEVKPGEQTIDFDVKK